MNIRSNPGEVLDSFFIKTHLLCVASVPGAKTNDLLGSVGVCIDDTNPELKLSHRKLDVSDIFITERKSSEVTSNEIGNEHIQPEISGNQNRNESTEKNEIPLESVVLSTSFTGPTPDSLTMPVPARSVTLEKLTEYVAYTQPPSPTNSLPEELDNDNSKRTPSAASSLPVQPMSTRLPTMWLGGQNGILYVYSGIAQWSHCIATIHLADSILQIVHYRGRVFVALANGQCCIFIRSGQTGL